MRLFLLFLFGGCLLLASSGKPSDISTAGGGKVAYRNYFMGNYYFHENQVEKATAYFKRAHQAAPNRIHFALAYALCLSETGRPKAALGIVASASGLLLPLHPDFARQRVTYFYVSAIVQTRAGRYERARGNVNQAIAAMKSLDRDEQDLQRLAGMHSLAGYLAVMSQEAPRAHRGLEAHVHLQKRELLQAFPILLEALALDSSRSDAKQNLQLLSDTLQLPYVIDHRPAQVPDYRKAGVYSTADYPHLPNRMEGLLPFGQYDEVLYLVDISGSMVMETVGCTGADRFTVMKEAAQYLLDFLPDPTLAGLATIGGDCGNAPDWWIPTDSLSRKDLRWEIATLNPNGTTPLLTTLVEAPTLFTDEPAHRKSIFFVSDGENVCSLPGVDICEWAGQLEQKNITLNVLTFLDKGLNNSGAFAEYACLADRSGGQVRYLDPLSCSIDDVGFDLVDQVRFELPELHRVNCWGGAVDALWAIYPAP